MPTDSQEFAQSVARLSRRLRQERHSDLSATQLSALGTILTKGPLTPSAIAAHERVQPPSMTRTVNCLVAAGLVNRDKHPDDGRQVLITISDKGEDVLAAERARRDQWLARRWSELETSERKLLRDATALLDKLAMS